MQILDLVLFFLKQLLSALLLVVIVHILSLFDLVSSAGRERGLKNVLRCYLVLDPKNLKTVCIALGFLFLTLWAPYNTLHYDTNSVIAQRQAIDMALLWFSKTVLG